MEGVTFSGGQPWQAGSTPQNQSCPGSLKECVSYQSFHLVSPLPVCHGSSMRLRTRGLISQRERRSEPCQLVLTATNALDDLGQVPALLACPKRREV